MKPVILLVEDNKDLLEVITEDLAELYDVVKACNGKEALSYLEKENIHLVISDVMMPVMNGFELCKAIKQSMEYCHIPVILLTARNSMAAKIEGLGLGAEAYIDKPFEMEYLLAHVGSLLHNRQKIKDFFSQPGTRETHHTVAGDPFIDAITRAILDNIDDFELDVTKLARLMDMSRTSLFRKIRSVTDLTPNELINLTRLKKAARLFEEGDYKVYEVADMVGYNSQTNFGRNFHKQFGMTPTEYQKSVQKAYKR